MYRQQHPPSVFAENDATHVRAARETGKPAEAGITTFVHRSPPLPPSVVLSHLVTWNRSKRWKIGGTSSPFKPAMLIVSATLLTYNTSTRNRAASQSATYVGNARADKRSDLSCTCLFLPT